MSIGDNKAVILRLIDAMNNKDNNVIDELIAPDYVDHLLPVRGLEAFKQYLNMYRNAFPDAHRTVKDIVAEGDKVWIYLEITATHTGEFRGLAPTGNKIRVPSFIIWRVVDGKATEKTQITDNTEFYKLVGIMEYTEQGKKLFPEETK